jgi:O-antigen/teichoic acid export membrane protein
MSTILSEKSFYRRIADNALYVFVGNGLTNAAMFVTSVLLARWLGVEAYGLLAFLLGTVNVATILTDLGLPTAATKRIAEQLGQRDIGAVVHTIHSFRRTIWLAGTIGALVCGTLIAAVPFSPLAQSRIMGSWLVGLWVLVPTVTKGSIAMFNGFQDMRFTLAGYLLQEPLKLGVLILLVLAGVLTLPILVWSWTLAYLIALVVVMLLGHHFLITRAGRTRYESRGPFEIATRLREGFTYFLPFVSITIMPSSTALILGLVSTKAETAWFAAGASLASVSFLVLGPMAQVLLPAFSHRYARIGQAITHAEGRQLLRMLTLFNVCVLSGFLLLGSLTVRWTYGAEFEPAATVLIVLAAANYFEALRLVVDPLLNSINAASTVSRIELVHYGIILPAVVGLGWRYGALGAASGVLLAALICNIIRLYVAQQRLNIGGVQLAPRFVVWVGAVLAAWWLGVPAWGIVPPAVLLGWGLGLYQPADLRAALRVVLPSERSG